TADVTCGARRLCPPCFQNPPLAELEAGFARLRPPRLWPKRVFPGFPYPVSSPALPLWPEKVSHPRGAQQWRVLEEHHGNPSSRQREDCERFRMDRLPGVCLDEPPPEAPTSTSVRQEKHDWSGADDQDIEIDCVTGHCPSGVRGPEQRAQRHGHARMWTDPEMV